MKEEVLVPEPSNAENSESIARPLTPVPHKGLRRNLQGETVWNLPVAGYRWRMPLEIAGSGFCYNYASHWSSAPEEAERLFTQSDIYALLDALSDGSASDRVTADAEEGTGRLDTPNSASKGHHP